MGHNKTAAEQEREIATKAANKARLAKTPLDKLKYQCMARGTKGLSALGRAFRIFDDDRSGKLEFEEFKKAMRDYQVNLSDDEVKSLFQQFDSDGGGSVDYEEFLKQLRPDMNQFRKDLVMKAFAVMDRTGDGLITTEDLKGVYKVKNHPKYLNGEKTEDELLLDFLKCFDSGDKDGKITKDEWLNYYSGVGLSIDEGRDGDNYFALMMTQTWGNL